MGVDGCLIQAVLMKYIDGRNQGRAVIFGEDHSEAARKDRSNEEALFSAPYFRSIPIIQYKR